MLNEKSAAHASFRCVNFVFLVASLSVSLIHRGYLVVSVNWQFWYHCCYLDVGNWSL